MCEKCLKWDKKEETEITARILALRDDQVAALFYFVGIRFKKNDIREVVAEIRKNKENAIHMSTLLSEADSKDHLLWWINYLEESN